jgi:SagB-type dehydrogenase family enzyme
MKDRLRNIILEFGGDICSVVNCVNRFLIFKLYMKSFISIVLCHFLTLSLISYANDLKNQNNLSNKLTQIKMEYTGFTYELPPPELEGNMNVEQVLFHRRSRRQYMDMPLSVQELSQVLWAAYGITLPKKDYSFLRGGLRTSPSAGALYPLEIYVLIGNVNGIKPGVYRYVSNGHKLIRTINRDLRSDLCEAALNQKMIKEAPIVLFYSAVFSRCTKKYGQRGRERYVYIELGHSAQNVYLQVEALQLGTCVIGAFNDSLVKEVLNLPKDEEPLYIMPVGHYYK